MSRATAARGRECCMSQRRPVREWDMLRGRSVLHQRTLRKENTFCLRTIRAARRDAGARKGGGVDRRSWGYPTASCHHLDQLRWLGRVREHAAAHPIHLRQNGRRASSSASRSPFASVSATATRTASPAVSSRSFASPLRCVFAPRRAGDLPPGAAPQPPRPIPGVPLPRLPP